MVGSWESRDSCLLTCIPAGCEITQPTVYKFVTEGKYVTHFHFLQPSELVGLPSPAPSSVRAATPGHAQLALRHWVHRSGDVTSRDRTTARVRI